MERGATRRAAGGGLLALAALPARAGSGVRRDLWIPVEGARLFVQLRGAEAGAPLLIWLHGGPGGAERPLFRLFDGGLERHFLVAYLDQRGAGLSFDPNADPRQLTIARHLADLDAVVDALRHASGQGAAILLGHSWGGALGLMYAKARPRKVRALLAVSPELATLPEQQAEFAFVESEARRRQDRGALAELARLRAPPLDVNGRMVMEHLCERYGGLYHRPPSKTLAALRALAEGIVSPAEIGRLLRGNDVSLAAMHAELMSLDLRLSLGALEAPVGLMLGRFDRHCDARIGAAWFETLSAPAKRLVWFENSAHNAPFEEPDRFVAAVPQTLRALDVLPTA